MLSTSQDCPTLWEWDATSLWWDSQVWCSPTALLTLTQPQGEDAPNPAPEQDPVPGTPHTELCQARICAEGRLSDEPWCCHPPPLRPPLWQ